jgi:hypothetical protein
MKTYLSILTIGLIALSSCTTPQGAQSKVYTDDLYYSSKDAAADKAHKQAEEAKAKADEAKAAAEEANRVAEAANKRVMDAGKSSPSDEYYTPSDKATTTVNNTTNNYYDDQAFNYDDYYDDEYAVRIRRFHEYCPSYGYYDNYYTNSYWYTGNPYNYGSSVYMGYNFWGPSYMNFAYNPGYNYYSNMGWGYDPYGYNPYGYNPYGYGGYGYNPYGYDPYMAGYNNGYNNGYYANNYFNSYDNNSYYYGPRRGTGGNGRVSTQPTLAHRMMDNMEGQAMNTPLNNTSGIRENNDNKVGNESGINPGYINSKPETNYTDRPTIKPTGSTNPAYKPETGNDRPINNYTPAENKPQPEYNKPPERPVYNNDKPTNYERQKPPAEIQQPKYDKPEPRVPRSEAPRNETYSSPSQYSSPAPSNNSRNNSSPGGSSKPRR